MRVDTCRCVARESKIAVAIVYARDHHTLVCSYHREEYLHLNQMAERNIGILNKKYEIVNLENNTIYL